MTSVLSLGDAQVFSDHEVSVKNRAVLVFSLSEFLTNFAFQICYCL